MCAGGTRTRPRVCYHATCFVVWVWRYRNIAIKRYSKNFADIPKLSPADLKKMYLIWNIYCSFYLKYPQSDKLSKNFMSFIRWFQQNNGTVKSSNTVRSHDAAPLRFSGPCHYENVIIWNGETWATWWWQGVLYHYSTCHQQITSNRTDYIIILKIRDCEWKKHSD